MKHLSKLKEENKEIQNIICWLEEFNISTYTKDMYSSLKKKQEAEPVNLTRSKFKEGIVY